MLVVAVVGLLALGVAACGAGPPPGTGDPGNVRLHALRSQAILTVLPPGAKVLSIKESPPVWDYVYGGWSGLDVREDFATTLAPAQVTSFYEAIAPKYGWRFEPTGGNFPNWSKRIRGEFTATMSVMWSDIEWNGTEYTPRSQNWELVLQASAILKTPS